MRAIYSGYLDIGGMIRIPIKLYNIVDKRPISFNQMSACCKTFVKQKLFCSKCGKELSRDEIKKGFWDGEKLIEVNKEYLEKIKLPTTEEIKVEGFVDEVPKWLYSGKHYFVSVAEKKDKKTKEIVKDVKARKIYCMFIRALKVAEKVAIGRVVLRNKEEVVAIEPFGDDGLVCSVLYFPEQIRDVEDVKTIIELDMEKAKISDAIMFIKAFSEKKKINLIEFKDRYLEQLLEIINGNVPEVEEEEEVKEVDDFSKALKLLQ